MVSYGLNWYFFETHTERVIMENGYIQEICGLDATFFATFGGDNFTFLHDNARSHTARCAPNYLNVVIIY